MQCEICGKTEQETHLEKGILLDKIVQVCLECAENDKIPLLKKPSQQQLEEADKRYSVRERMEKISGMKDATELSSDQIDAHKNLNRLKDIPKKQFNEKLQDDYNWRIKMGRRRNKLTISQLSSKTGIPETELENLEKGLLPDNFEELAQKLESALNTKLLKSNGPKINFSRKKDEEKEILQKVKVKLENHSELPEKQQETKEKSDKLKNLQKGKLDLSKRQNLQDISLNDLIDMKRNREKQQKQQKEKKQEEDLLGEDLDLDEV